jgi:hypothetical protein
MGCHPLPPAAGLTAGSDPVRNRVLFCKKEPKNFGPLGGSALAASTIVVMPGFMPGIHPP